VSRKLFILSTTYSGGVSKGIKLELTIVHADVQDLLRNNLADNRADQAVIYAKLINRLKAAGADCVAITSLGGHFCFDKTVTHSSCHCYRPWPRWMPILQAKA